MARESIVFALKSLASESVRKFSDEEKRTKLETWEFALSDLEDEQINYGLTKILRSPNPFIPDVGTFREMCITSEGSQKIEDEASEAWALLRSNLNRYASPVFKNAVIAETVRKIGGWSYLCDMLTKDEPFRRQEFIESYSVMSRRGGEYYPALTGIHDNKNFIGYSSNEEIKEAQKQLTITDKTETKLIDMIK